MEKAIIENCQFREVCLDAANLIKIRLRKGNWSQSDLHNSSWTGSQILDICFQKSNFQGARLHKTRFTNCDFRDANLVATTAYDAVFENCDFRNADINDFVFKNTLFYKCGFYGCKNAPTLEGNCTIIDADMSEDFDGSKIVGSDSLLQLWGVKQQAVVS